MAVKPEVHYALSGDVNIAYYLLGDGPIDLVGIPAFVSHGELLWEHPLWQHAADRFARFARLVWIDKRGTGLSDRGVGVPTVEQAVGDVLAVMDAVGCERPVLWGQSEGGPAAVLLAATHPHRVHSLVLYGSYAKVARSADYPIGIPAEFLEATRDHLIGRWGTGVGLGAWAPSGADDPEFREAWARYQRMAASPRDARAVVEMYSSIDVRPALAAVSAPTLVIHRRGDRMVPWEMGRYLADHIAGARMVTLEGSDHMMFTEPGDHDVIDEIEEFTTGQRSTAEPTRRLATVMFTDIVGSTERAAQLGDAAWRGLLERHDDVLRRSLERFGGREVKTLGDGFLALFDGPTAAIRCADAVRGGAEGLGLSVRAGIHSGEVELLEGDIGGIAVHLTRRVVDQAGDGEILVSSTVPGLCVGSGIEFEDRGERELRGLEGAWRLHAVAG